MNLFAIAVICLQYGAMITYWFQGKFAVGTLWGLYATANIVLYGIGNKT